MNKIAPYWKAVVGFIAPGIVLLAGAATPGSDGGAMITGHEWLTALIACVITSAGVYNIPNKDPRATHQDESVQPPAITEVDMKKVRNEGGYANGPYGLVGVLVVVLLVFILLAVTGVIGK